MRNIVLLCSFWILTTAALGQEQKSPELFVLNRADLAGENLVPRKVKGEPDLTFYQQEVYRGNDLLIYILALANRTNELQNFPIEEFVFWMNGKAVVEPLADDVFEVQTGDYFIQPKGFNGRWHFVNEHPFHLELSVITKSRATTNSPIDRAMIIDKNIISGASPDHKGSISNLYEGVELNLNLLNSSRDIIHHNPKERLVHMLNGILTIMSKSGTEHTFYPGDFFVIPEGFSGHWRAKGLQSLRAFEITKSDLLER